MNDFTARLVLFYLISAPLGAIVFAGLRFIRPQEGTRGRIRAHQESGMGGDSPADSHGQRLVARTMEGGGHRAPSGTQRNTAKAQRQTDKSLACDQVRMSIPLELITGEGGCH
jgi:hypothetical protein